VRNCRLDELRDLRGDADWVRDQISNYMNNLISWGVAGFRLDAAKHMWPTHINDMLDDLTNLSTQWFPKNTRPYIYQEVFFVLFLSQSFFTNR
jgi:alpha-amylase